MHRRFWAHWVSGALRTLGISIALAAIFVLAACRAVGARSDAGHVSEPYPTSPAVGLAKAIGVDLVATYDGESARDVNGCLQSVPTLRLVLSCTPAVGACGDGVGSLGVARLRFDARLEVVDVSIGGEDGAGADELLPPEWRMHLRTQAESVRAAVWAEATRLGDSAWCNDIYAYSSARCAALDNQVTIFLDESDRLFYATQGPKACPPMTRSTTKVLPATRSAPTVGR